MPGKLAPRVFEAPGLAVRTRLAEAQGPTRTVAARGERPIEERASRLGAHRLEQLAGRAGRLANCQAGVAGVLRRVRLGLLSGAEW